ncbi:nuclease-related domain-containing protein [Pedococcus sp. KACC 23699]|uniref:Nuclease-related domain-containing protein n=1 Tax=Pedococcus sp. KACC 23699 TaxID=3149228 RepID=A0AAU7JRG8_9MICO
MNDQDLVVTRWRRYGKDRLYVAGQDGLKIGFWDLASETSHPESPQHEPSLLTAVAHWKLSAGHCQTEFSSVPIAGQAPSAEGECTPAEQMVVEAEATLTPNIDGDASAAATVSMSPAEEGTEDLDDPTPTVSDSATGAAVLAVPQVMPVRPWVDLATNRAGAEARERALAARGAAPVKTVFARVLGVHTNERAWRIGADGEEKVAAQLAKVAKKDQRWRFLHAVPVGNRGSDIDHIIVGPGGVFTANAKHHPGAKIWVGGNTFMVNGAKQPYIRNARHEAQRAAKILGDACGFPVFVEGLIITVNASDVTVKAQPDGVIVVPRMQVAKWLPRLGDILTMEDIDAIYDVARRSTTWR